MKARLVPIYFEPGRDAGFDTQLAVLRNLIGDRVEFLPPVGLGRPLPACDAVVFPQFLGEGYRRLADFRKIDMPILVITSEFGTMSMWDWELIEYLRGEGVATIAPYDLEQTKRICAALAVKRELRETKFLVFQDNPGEGAQAPIFKRFYWWEDECTQRMLAKFGVTIQKKSFKALGAESAAVSDAEAQAVLRQKPLPGAQGAPGATGANVSGKPALSAAKLYIAVKRHIDGDSNIRAVGINCLNESHFCDTTPCLAWNWLYEERQLLWGCEADTMAMLSKFILHRSLGLPIFMTNLYPFLMGNAALKHEKIAAFPQVDAGPENHILIAHCGYMGVIPQSFSTRWSLKPKVLAIVDDNATAIDADFPTGPVTLAKLHPSMTRMTVAEADLTGYANFPGSDCLNGGVVKVRDGHKLMATLSSHHYLVTTGHNRVQIGMIGKVFGFEVDEI